MKVAIIGCGTIANAAHIPAYLKNPEAEIKYFCDIIPERAEKAVEKYGCGQAITDYHTALDDPEIEAVPSARPTTCIPSSPSTRCARAKTCCAKSPALAPTKKRSKCRRCSTRPARY
jgi:hypothetical protein